ncbi:MAG: hypothetical protein DHS20C15_22280 [Planctomycetota bacterium]|nr:MAG: hypothetical protein DHS20C15_22280 [Planctomycetota bacterium]
MIAARDRFPRFVFRSTALALLSALVLLTGCGGGGGGGGGKKANPDPAEGVSFLGFSFRTAPTTTTTTPPLEDATASPPSLGGPLNTVVIFRFDGVPVGTFDQTTLPVFTTPGEIDPSAGAPASNPVIPAKGTYVPVGNTVEFRPFVPTGAIHPVVSAPAGSIPGLFPASIYTALVSTNPLSMIDNLLGSGGTVKFGTTSNEAAYFPLDPNAADPPAVIAKIPADGTDTFFPGIFSNQPITGGADVFAPGPDSILLTYDRALLPTTANLSGTDIDGDGLVDGNFFMRSRATELLVAHQVPANTFGAHAAFSALSGLEVGDAPASNGNDVVLQSAGVLVGPDASLPGQPVSLAPGRDPDLLFAILEVLGDSDQLGVADRLMGDPSFAQFGVEADEGAASAALDTGLDSAVGLTTLLDGRLVTYDQATRRIYELLPTVIRRRPSPGVTPGPPVLVSLAVGNGVTGFRSAEVVGPADREIIDLAQAPSGELFALAHDIGAPFPSIIRLQPIDRDSNGVFGDDDGVFLNEAGDVLLNLSSAYADMVFESDRTVLALNRSTDTIDRINIDTGSVSTAVAGVAAFDMPLGGFPGGLSPARALTAGFMEIDVNVALVTNSETGALVRVSPVGILPIGQSVSVMQRNTFSSLVGGSVVVSNPGEPIVNLGASAISTVITADPQAGPGITITDTFIEDFDTNTLEGDAQTSLGPTAEWALPLSGGLTTKVLRASTGLVETSALGNFLPSPRDNYKPLQAYVRSPAPPDTFIIGSSTAVNGGIDYVDDPEVSTSMGVYREIFLNTISQEFPLPNGSTPGISEPTTVQGGRFAFGDFIVPPGVRVIGIGSNPLVITASGSVVIGGMIDVSGRTGLTDDSFDSGFLPVRGGPGGPGGGRGGDAHPTIFDPSGPGSIDQYVTPEKAENGLGPVVSATGKISFQPVGGRGAVSTAGYRPTNSDDSFPAAGVITPATPGTHPDMPGFRHSSDWMLGSEIHRPPGGGGGSFRSVGQPSHYGSGSYLVQSDSTFFPFSMCGSMNDQFQFIQYGNEENLQRGLMPNTPLQCVYMLGTPGNLSYRLPGTLPGVSPFADGNPENDFLGEGGEVPVLIGGQGGGGGGTRVDSIDQSEWAADRLGAPDSLTPPFYTFLSLGVLTSPTVYDSKGGAGGGGGGAVQIRSFGDITIQRTGYIKATGGIGGGGEVIGNSISAGGGGGGSGGAILLQAAGTITLEADATNTEAGYLDADDMAQGASLNVSGGFGDDARDDPQDPNNAFQQDLQYHHGRGDGGQGGMGIIQLQAGIDLEVEPGVTMFANQRAVLKYGDGSEPVSERWNPRIEDDQRDHPYLRGLYDPQDDNDLRPFDVRYIDMLHYRYFNNNDTGPVDHFYTLNGAYPPIIPHPTGDMGQSLIHESPASSGTFWGDTKMMEHPDVPGLMVVQEPEPEKRIKLMNPIEDTLRRIDEGGPNIQSNLKNAADQLFNDNYEPELFAQYGHAPGIPYEPDDEIPFAVRLSDTFIARVLADEDKNQTTGNPVMIEQDGQMILDPSTLVSRLPVVHPDKTPKPLSGTSRGISKWLDYAGATIRSRALDGRSPPFFEPINGTFNAAQGPVSPELDGVVMISGNAPDAPTLAKLVKNAEAKLSAGTNPPPLNDIKVDAPDVPIGGGISGIENAVSNNAMVSLMFQGAYTVRSGSHVPDLTTLTPWVSDLTELDGFPLVRFQVVFNLDSDDPQFSFGASSMRPAVDYVRMRSTY